MAQWTIELRNLAQVTTLFEFEYEVPDFIDKTILEQGFIDYYYFREIGFEVPERFKFRLKQMWQMHAPRYYKLWEANAQDIQALVNYTQDSSGKAIYKDTPLNEMDDNDLFATNLNKTTNTVKGINNMLQIEALKRYNQDLENITENFYKEFGTLFMGVY